MGVHFTPGTPLVGMNVLTAHVRNLAGGNINWVAMVARLSGWASSSTGLTNKELLASYFRSNLRFHGPVTYADLNWAAPSYDVRCTAGITPTLEYRATPNPNPSTVVPLPTVYRLVNGATALRDTTGAFPIHQTPNNVAGFARLDGYLSDIAV